MSFNDDDTSEVGLAGQSKLESFLFSKELFNSLSARLRWRTRGSPL